MLPVSATSVSFPNQKRIFDYVNSHPKKNALRPLDDEFQNINTIARAFGNKVMQREEIAITIREAFSLPRKEIFQLKAALAELASKRRIDEEESPQEISIRCQLLSIESAYEFPVFFYEDVLNDLLEKIIFIPPKDGEIKWTRIVGQF